MKQDDLLFYIKLNLVGFIGNTFFYFLTPNYLSAMVAGGCLITVIKDFRLLNEEKKRG